MKQNKSGFTIVELLIVIIILAILAAVSVVAYNGISNRAHAAKKLAAVQSYVKLINLYKAEHGVYPVGTFDGDLTSYSPYFAGRTACLGLPEHYPEQDGFGDGHCMLDTEPENRAPNSVPFFATSTELNNKLKPYGTFADPLGPVVKDGPIRWRGILYHRGFSGDPDAVMITWEIPGNNEAGCGPSGQGFYGSYYGDTTFCRMDINFSD